MMRLKLYAGGALAFVVWLVTFGLMKKREGAKEVQHEFEQDKARRIDAGRDKVREGRDSGLSPADRLRRNDGHWGGM